MVEEEQRTMDCGMDLSLRVLPRDFSIVNACVHNPLDQMDLPFDFHFLPLSYPAPAVASSDKPMCDFKLARLEEVRADQRMI